MKTYLIGRSPYADVVIADPSVSERHAEIVQVADGRLFVTDCGSRNGTWRLDKGAGRTAWQPIRQRFLEPADVLRLGDYQCTLSELLGSRRETEGPSGGRIERDPATGELVRRRP